MGHADGGYPSIVDDSSHYPGALHEAIEYSHEIVRLCDQAD
jgi:hypothetical protein